MIVCGHQTIGNDIYQFTLEVLPQAAEEEAPIVIAKEDGLSVDSTVVDVIVLSGLEHHFATGHIVPSDFQRAFRNLVFGKNQVSCPVRLLMIG